MAEQDVNIGILDRTARILIGLIGLAFAMQLGFADAGWNWIGWLGLVPLLSGLVGVCPLYVKLGMRTCRS